MNTATAEALVLLDGDLLADRLPALQDQIAEVLATMPLSVCLDFEKVQAVDGAGVGFLVALGATMRTRGTLLRAQSLPESLLPLYQAFHLEHFVQTDQ